MTEERMKEVGVGEVLEVEFTDPGAGPDLRAWCRATRHEMLDVRNDRKKFFAYIRKQDP